MRPEDSFHENLGEFLAEVKSKTREIKYGWNRHKEASCQWIVDRLLAGWEGVDVGGTEFIAKAASQKGCKISLFDWHPNDNFTPSIADDMRNILDHFEKESLDFITTRHTLEHALFPLFQLWAFNRILKKEGALLVIVPAPNMRWHYMVNHYSCLSHEHWLSLFHKSNFKVVAADAGTWNPANPDFIEYRYHLEKESDGLRL